MSQAGIIDVEGSHPQIPTSFETDSGTAIPIANVLEVLGTIVPAHSIPLRTTGSGNTVTIQTQYASAAASSVGTNAGLASFNSSQFTVDANGFVSISGSATVETFTVDAATPPGTNPVTPNGSGNITVTGGQVAAGTTTNVIRTNSLAANTYTIQVQRSQAVASSTVGDNGVSHFNSAQFTVDTNGFVSLVGGAATTNFQVDAHTAPGTEPVVPNASGTVIVTGGQVAAGTTTNVIQTNSLAANTYTVQVQRSQAVASSTIGDNGVSHYSSSQFAVDSNGFVTLAGGTGPAILQIALQTGTTPISPSAGLITFNGSTVTAGTNPVRTNGTGASTMALQVQISQAIASTNVTNVGLAAFNSSQFTVDANGFVSLTGTGTLDTLTGDSGTATASGNNINVYGNTAPASTGLTFTGAGATLSLGGILVVSNGGTGRATLTNHSVIVGAGTTAVTQVGPSATLGAVFIGNGASADPLYSTTCTVLDSIGVLLESASLPAGGTQIANENTSTTVGACARNVIASAAQGVTSDAYILYALNNSSPSSWEAGAQGTALASNFVIQANPANSHPYMDGTTVFQLTQAGVPSFPQAPLGVPSGGTGSTSFNTNGAVISGTTSTSPLASVSLSNQQFLVGNTSAAPTAKTWKVNFQTFSSTGTYTPTSGMVYCIIEMVGGGGGGGSATNGGNSLCAGTGGGGGEYAAGIFTTATIGASQAVTIGAAGAAVTAGGNTSVGSTLLSAIGGGAGVSGTPQTATSNSNFPVAGGTGGTGGSVRFPGGASGGGWVTPTGAMAAAGDGGTSRFSQGVKGITILNGTLAQTTNGTAATGFGGGGSGALSYGVGSGTATGGAGSAGYVVITEFILS